MPERMNEREIIDAKYVAKIQENFGDAVQGENFALSRIAANISDLLGEIDSLREQLTKSKTVPLFPYSSVQTIRSWQRKTYHNTYIP